MKRQLQHNQTQTRSTLRKKKKKNNNNNSKMSSQEQASVWIQLYVGATKSGGVFCIRPIPENVYALTEAIKVENAVALSQCDADELNVFAVGTSVPTTAGTEPLDPWDPVPTGTTGPAPLIVVAPVPQPQDGDLRDTVGNVEGMMRKVVEYVAEQKREAEPISLSNVNTKTYESVGSLLNLKLKGCTWHTRPEGLASPPNFVWNSNLTEADASNRSLYMSHLREQFTWPNSHTLVDCNEAGHGYKNLLGTTKFDGIHSTSGNIDVVVVEEVDARNETIKQNIMAGIELKNTRDNRDHERQVILQHLAASLLNPDFGMLTLMTDLNTRWHFYWFAAAGSKNAAGSKKVVLKLKTNGQEAAFLLEHMFDDPDTVDAALCFPLDFLKRGTWTSLFSPSPGLQVVPENGDIRGGGGSGTAGGGGGGGGADGYKPQDSEKTDHSCGSTGGTSRDVLSRQNDGGDVGNRLDL